jgi:hypothetical protein
MKAKDFIIIGGAIALYYLYQKNKTKKSMTSTAEAEAQDEATSSGGSGSMSSGGTSTPVTPTPSTPVIITPVSEGTTSGSQAVVTVTPVDDSPIRTITNPEIIVGGTTPVPALVPPPIQTPEEALISGGIRPIVKPIRTISTEISQI